MRWLDPIAIAVAGLQLAACTPSAAWMTSKGSDHALVGRIWDVRAERFVTESDLADDAAIAMFVLLGEKHDNPDHHLLQSKVLAALVERGRRPVVAYEMLTTDQAPALSAHLQEHPRDASGLGDAVGWEMSGWPTWKQYQPIADVALKNGLPLTAVSPSREIIGIIRNEGLKGLDAEIVVRTALDRPLDPKVQAAMEDEIREAHCGYLPERAVPSVVRMQRVRDAIMADNWASASLQADGGVLIAGAGHARNDRGVPTVLSRLRLEARSVSISFLEVRDDWIMPEAYAELFGVTALPFDFVWFTPRLEDADACEKFSADLERLRSK